MSHLPSDKPLLSIGHVTRRTFLSASAAAFVASAVRVRVPAASASSAVQPGTPDAGGFTRPTGWGVCVPSQPMWQIGAWTAERSIELLRPVSWHSWGIWPECSAVNRRPMIFSDQYFDRTAVRQRLIDHPGEVWQLFNEPDLSEQANMSPSLAVEVSLEFIDLAKSVGNKFQWMSPSVTLHTNHNGLAWLTEYMTIMRQRKGIMRPAMWGIHPYSCPTTWHLRRSMSEWWDWYAIWGSGAPTVITEVCAEESSLADQIDVMDECSGMLKRGEVAGVFWYAAYRNSENWQHYPLTTLDVDAQSVTLTPLGEHWMSLK